MTILHRIPSHIEETYKKTFYLLCARDYTKCWDQQKHDTHGPASQSLQTNRLSKFMTQLLAKIFYIIETSKHFREIEYEVIVLLLQTIFIIQLARKQIAYLPQTDMAKSNPV